MSAYITELSDMVSLRRMVMVVMVMVVSMIMVEEQWRMVVVMVAVGDGGVDDHGGGQDVRIYYRALRYGEHKGEGNDDDGGGNVDDHGDKRGK